MRVLAGKASAPLLPQLAQSLPDWFEGTRHSSFLYVASELVKVFGSDPSQRQQLGVPLAPLHVLVASTCQCSFPVHPPDLVSMHGSALWHAVQDASSEVDVPDCSRRLHLNRFPRLLQRHIAVPQLPCWGRRTQV